MFGKGKGGDGATQQPVLSVLPMIIASMPKDVSMHQRLYSPPHLPLTRRHLNRPIPGSQHQARVGLVSDAHRILVHDGRYGEFAVSLLHSDHADHG